MVEIVESQTVGSPASVVWATLADFDAISQWAPNVDHSCSITHLASGVGATRRIQTGRTTVRETVTGWEPERMLSYEIVGLPPVIRSVTNTWRLEDRGERTEVTLTSQVDAGPRPPQQLIARIAGRALGKASRQMLDGLDRHLQAQHKGTVA